MTDPIEHHLPKLPENWALISFGLHTGTFDDLTISVHIHDHKYSFIAVCHPMIVRAVIEKISRQYGKEPSADMLIPLIEFESGKLEDRSKYESWIWEWVDK